jgi:hypothetical protein
VSAWAPPTGNAMAPSVPIALTRAETSSMAPKTHLFPQRKNDVFKKTLVVRNEVSHKEDRT